MANEIDFFSNLDPAQVSRVTALCREESYKPGQFIFREGDLSEDMYIVAEGQVEVGHDLDQPDRCDTLGHIYEGESFGEMSFFDSLPRSMDARAASDTRLHRLSRERWEELIGTDRALGVALLENLACIIGFRLRTTNWDLVMVKGGHHLKAEG